MNFVLDVTEWRKMSPILANILAFIHVDSHVEFNSSDYIAEYHEINLLFALSGLDL